MTDRRRAAAPPPSRALQEIRDMLAEQGGRTDAQNEGLNDRMDRFERDLREGNLKTDKLVNDFQELRMQFGEVRDATNLGQTRAVASAAKGGAEGAAATAAIVAADVAKTVAVKNPWPKYAAVLGAIILTIQVVGNIPDLQRVVEKVWGFTRELDQPPAAPPAEKDDKHD